MSKRITSERIEYLLQLLSTGQVQMAKSRYQVFNNLLDILLEQRLPFCQHRPVLAIDFENKATFFTHNQTFLYENQIQLHTF